ncbi:MAG: Asp23/Gls24 family envelope stress response protein [Acidimicrobiales bacterium]|nr:Asp23/Gls24 family envelope stress response protein [Acidimicrobiales bacterium]
MAQQTTTDLRPGDSNALVTGQGRTSIADSVVEKIAGVAAREVSGVHEMGRGAARAFGTIKERLPGGGAGPNATQGISVEVGERQAAVDIDLVVDYGVSIPDVAQSVRDNVIQRIERMTGLQVTEVNVSVDDVYLGDDSTPEPPRVQ